MCFARHARRKPLASLTRKRLPRVDGKNKNKSGGPCLFFESIIESKLSMPSISKKKISKK